MLLLCLNLVKMILNLRSPTDRKFIGLGGRFLPLHLNCEVDGILLMHRSNSFHSLMGKTRFQKNIVFVNGNSKLALFLKSQLLVELNVSGSKSCK